MCMWINPCQSSLLPYHACPLSASSPHPITPHSHSLNACQSSLQPYHGWVTQKAFAVAVQTVPEWPTVLLKLAPDQETFRDDVEAWVRSSPVPRLTAILTELDLIDTRVT